MTSVVDRIERLEAEITRQVEPKLLSIERQLAAAQRQHKHQQQQQQQKQKQTDPAAAVTHEGESTSAQSEQQDPQSALVEQLTRDRDAVKAEIAQLQSQLKALRAENRQTAIVALLLVVLAYMIALVLGYIE